MADVTPNFSPLLVWQQHLKVFCGIGLDMLSILMFGFVQIRSNADNSSRYFLRDGRSETLSLGLRDPNSLYLPTYRR